ncbi:MAG TPA: HD domain-containing phosphohydrolase [Blastocatellia bacterium]|nr:HD domain-containing phosphohydrolase [Blastocatellia bacterium]
METAKGKTREDIINRLADRIDSFEKYTQPHSRLMAELAAHLARRFGLAAPDVDAITEAAMLHDIGLYTMSPAYHAFPRPLSFEARLDLWRHPVIGEQQMAKRDAMRHAQLLVRWHHEWWNGSGYPDMLAFEDIPVGARIVRAVELYAALLCDRPYRSALDDPQAVETLTASAGIECDPYVVKALLALLNELRAGIQQPAAWELANPAEVEAAPDQFPLLERAIAVESPPALTAAESSSDLLPAHPTSSTDAINSEPASSYRPWGEGLKAFVPLTSEPPEQQASQPTLDGTHASDTASPAQPARRESAPAVHLIESLLARARSDELARSDSPRWRGWSGSRYNKKTLLGFQASVLRQLEFRSIAIPFWSEARLDWYLKAWGKLIFANHPSGWGGIVARANVEATQPLGEDTITRVLEDVYIPGVRLANPDLRRWFGETDAWWMDNLRRNIEALDDQVMRAQALTLGLHTGDYALSFDEETLDLRRPLTTVYWRLAGRAFAGPAGQPHNRSFNQPAEDFIKHARADLLYLRSPDSHTDHGGAQARSEWREAWVSGPARHEADEETKGATPPQSKQSYLASLDRLLKHAANFKTWAAEYQEPGLATAQDIIELIKEYRPVKATYSKDVTEVAGGLRSYIIVGEKASSG